MVSKSKMECIRSRVIVPIEMPFGSSGNPESWALLLIERIVRDVQRDHPEADAPKFRDGGSRNLAITAKFCRPHLQMMRKSVH
jgi:hypothetical protein